MAFLFFAWLAALFICWAVCLDLIILTNNIRIPIGKYLRFPFCNLAELHYFPVIVIDFSGHRSFATLPLRCGVCVLSFLQMFDQQNMTVDVLASFQAQALKVTGSVYLLSLRRFCPRAEFSCKKSGYPEPSMLWESSHCPRREAVLWQGKSKEERISVLQNYEIQWYIVILSL